jgi:histone deacetylase HOS3
MSRHGRRVPTSFYHKFTKDVTEFAAKYARSRVVSVLEGGYSARALTSGAFAHLIGLAGIPSEKVTEEWWSVENLIKVSIRIY